MYLTHRRCRWVSARAQSEGEPFQRWKPGLQPRLNLDTGPEPESLGGYHGVVESVELAYWFPQLGIDLPPHGADFGYHAGTTCVVDFAEVYNASTGQVNDLAKEADVAHRTLTGRVV